MIQRILVPLDGSELSELALYYAEELTWALGAELHLASVCELAEKGYLHMCQSYLDEVLRRARGNIRSYEPQGSQEIKITAATLEGSPATEILRYAGDNAIDLIVLTSHGRSGATSLATGSTSTKIVFHAPQPILLVRANTSFVRPPRKEMFSKILVPLDGSETGEVALPYVKEITDQLQSELTLLHVVPTGQYVRTFGGLKYFLFPE
ncbi:MAG: universal stress protein, partial [Chloroflexi bacterium]|nr:universal stress protein [Chloroflexota bacterium]